MEGWIDGYSRPRTSSDPGGVGNDVDAGVGSDLADSVVAVALGADAVELDVAPPPQAPIMTAKASNTTKSTVVLVMFPQAFGVTSFDSATGFATC